MKPQVSHPTPHQNPRPSPQTSNTKPRNNRCTSSSARRRVCRTRPPSRARATLPSPASSRAPVAAVARAVTRFKRRGVSESETSKPSRLACSLSHKHFLIPAIISGPEAGLSAFWGGVLSQNCSMHVQRHQLCSQVTGSCSPYIPDVELADRMRAKAHSVSPGWEGRARLLSKV